VARLAELNDAGEHGLRPLHLTERERVLLPLLSTDDRVPEIARKLHVSVNTVRKQVVTLREKFQAGTRAELIRRARNYGALD
jgi:DNA-binding NarL/FixJ family response regulator